MPTRLFALSFVGGLALPAASLGGPGSTNGGACTMDVTSAGSEVLQAGLSFWNALQICKEPGSGPILPTGGKGAQWLNEAAGLLGGQSAVGAAPAAPAGAATPAGAAGPDITVQGAQLRKLLSAEANHAISCVADVGGVLNALANVGQYILAVIESCTGRPELGDECAKRSLVLAGSVAQSVGTATSLSNGCQARAFHMQAMSGNAHGNAMSGAQCLVDVRGAIQGLLQTVGAITQVKQQCEYSPEQCTSFSAHIVASLASIAKFVLSSAGDCIHQLPPGEACGVEIATLIQSLTTIASAGVTVEQACGGGNKTLAVSPEAVKLPATAGMGIINNLMGKLLHGTELTPASAPISAPISASPVTENTAPIEQYPSKRVLSRGQTAAISMMRTKFTNFHKLFEAHHWQDAAVKPSTALPLPVLAALLSVSGLVCFLAGRFVRVCRRPTSVCEARTQWQTMLPDSAEVATSEIECQIE